MISVLFPVTTGLSGVLSRSGLVLADINVNPNYNGLLGISALQKIVGSVSGRRSPQPSPRRSPRVAYSRHSACSRSRAARARNTRVWSGVQTMTGDGRGGDPDVNGADPPAIRGGPRRPDGYRSLSARPRRAHGPHQGPGPVTGGELDQGGDVGQQHAGVLADLAVDRRTERGADPLLRGRADLAAAPDRGSQRGVAAGAGGGDGLVEFLDSLEYRGDVGDAEPLDGDGADVRLVVQADVGGVAADGAGPFLLGGQRSALFYPHDPASVPD